MSEAVQEIKICTKCDAEIRSGSLFCYGCGTAIPEVESPEEESVEDAETVETEVVEKTSLEQETSLQQDMPSQQEMEEMFEPSIEPIPKPDIAIEGKENAAVKSKSKQKPVTGKMPTAASIRQKKDIKEPVQKIYTWQENNESSLYFILGAIIFIIAGISLVFLGLYIR